MKTKKLIQLLQESDPEGDIEVCIGNQSVIGVERAPAYYDGAMKLVTNNDGYAPAGFKIVRSGLKINICAGDIEIFLMDHPEGPVDTSELAPGSHYFEQVEKLRQQGRDYQKEAEKIRNNPEVKG